MSDIFVAKDTGTLTIGDEQFEIRDGVTRVRAGHPLLARYPECFRNAEEHVHYEWETATREPKVRARKAAEDAPVEAPVKRDPKRSED